MVEMLSSFLSGLGGNKRAPRGSPRSTQQSTSQEDDQEEDGFLFLGATHSERSTTDSTFQADAPPSYESEVGLPTFDEVIQGRQYAINYQPMSLPTQVHQQCGAAMDLMMTETSSKSTALHDVPFQLSRDLEMRVNWETYLFHVPALPPTDNSGYEYDFTCEKAVMQETTSEEMRSGTFQEWTDNRCPPSQNITDSISNSIQTRQDPYSAPDLISFE